MDIARALQTGVVSFTDWVKFHEWFHAEEVLDKNKDELSAELEA